MVPVQASHRVKVHVGHEHLAWFSTLSGPNHSGSLKLIHDLSGSWIAYLKPALKESGGAYVLVEYLAGGSLEKRVSVDRNTSGGTVGSLGSGWHILGEFISHWISGLMADGITYGLYFGSVDECTLHSVDYAVAREEHVASSDELIGSGAVENDAAFELLCHSECDSAGEVGADHTRDDVGRWSLGSENHMDAHGTRFLGNTGN